MTMLESPALPSTGEASSSKRPAIKNPSLWLIVPTLSLLTGQAAAVAPFAIPISWSSFLSIPIFFLFWRGKTPWAFLAIVSAAVFSLGYARHYRILYPSFPSSHVRSVMNEGSELYLEGTLHQEPEKLPQRSRWVLRSERVWHPTGAQEISGDILINVRDARREWRYGDRIRLHVRPLIPRSNHNPGSFDYASYLARRQIYATGSVQNDEGVELLARHPPLPWNWIEYLRREIRHFIDRNFPPDHSGLLKALTVGDMGTISKEVRADFTAAGVNHVLSISGLHVGMLGLVVFFLIRFFGGFSSTLLLRWNLLKIATFFSFLAVLFYTSLAGAMVPTVRSAIMIGVYELAVLLDREEEVVNSLTFAALLIALVWPGVVMDISFQLCFLSVIFIVWGSRKIQEWFPSPTTAGLLPQERSWLRRKMRPLCLNLAVPVLATIGTGPMIAHYFGHISLAGFISTPFVVPLVGFVIVPAGLLLGFFALVFPGLVFPLVGVVELLLSLNIRIVGWLARLPLANIAVPIPNVREVAILYGAICAVLLLRRRRYSVALLITAFLALTMDGVYWWQERQNRKELRVTYLSVGHGDAAVVEFPGSKVLLIDAGGTANGEFDTGAAIVAAFLRSRKILKVDYLLVSYSRVDHYGGMKAIVEEFQPEEFWTGRSDGRALRYRDLEEAVTRVGARRTFLTAGEPCRFIDRVKLCILHPIEESEREASVAMRVSMGKINFIFAGDIEGRDEKRMLDRGADLSGQVLKVPRHGSLSASSEGFVAAVKPRLAIFSVSDRNRFGLPRGEVTSRYAAAGAEILRTDQDGAIIVETDGQKLQYGTYASGKQGEIFPDRSAVPP